MSAVSTEQFTSILARPNGGHGVTASADALHDLGLDIVFGRLGDDAPAAVAAFTIPLTRESDVVYRQQCFMALEDARLRGVVEAFLTAITTCRHADDHATDAHYRYGPELWHLHAVTLYAAAVHTLADGLGEVVPQLATASAGFDALRRYAAAYREGAHFAALDAGARSLTHRIQKLDFAMLIRGGSVSVAAPDHEADLHDAVLETFQRFRGDGVMERPASAPPGGMDHVQAAVLERVASVHPEVFAQVEEFAADSEDYRDPTLQRFADEVRFYLAYLDYLRPLRDAGLSISYPTVSPGAKDLCVTATWELALASDLVEQGRAVVCNDLTLTGRERILVISGPNQGGKTTMARTFGQIHHLAAIGCPVPGTQARVPLADRVLTIFEREETLDSLEGRLGTEIRRLRDLFEAATSRSVIVINEAFASTALRDARVLTTDVLERITALDALAVCVTFIDELSRLNQATVSMVSTVDADDPAIRTFAVERRPADGRAYARALAAKHGLTAAQIASQLAHRRAS